MNGVWLGAGRDPGSVVETHLFGVAPNNSGSTFLKNALATCRQTWNLVLEGQFAFGFAGPNTRNHGRLLWSCPPGAAGSRRRGRRKGRGPRRSAEPWASSTSDRPRP